MNAIPNRCMCPFCLSECALSAAAFDSCSARSSGDMDLRRAASASAAARISKAFWAKKSFSRSAGLADDGGRGGATGEEAMNVEPEREPRGWGTSASSAGGAEEEELSSGSGAGDGMEAGGGGGVEEALEERRRRISEPVGKPGSPSFRLGRRRVRAGSAETSTKAGTAGAEGAGGDGGRGGGAAVALSTAVE